MAEPVVEPGRAELGAITGDKGAFAQLGAVVLSLRIGDYPRADPLRSATVVGRSPRTATVRTPRLPDIVTRLTLIYEDGRTDRCPRVLTGERG